MPTFNVSSNDLCLGLFKARTAKHACNKYAKNAGYLNVIDMEEQLKQKTHLIATEPTYLSETVGLEASRGKLVGKMMRVRYYRINKEQVRLVPTSGRSLEEFEDQAVIVLNEKFADRSYDPYDSVKEARWALNRCGWVLMSEAWETERF